MIVEPFGTKWEKSKFYSMHTESSNCRGETTRQRNVEKMEETGGARLLRCGATNWRVSQVQLTAAARCQLKERYDVWKW